MYKAVRKLIFVNQVHQEAMNHEKTLMIGFRPEECFTCFVFYKHCEM